MPVIHNQTRGGKEKISPSKMALFLVKNGPKLQARTMYKGISSPLAGVAAINAICFGVYGNVNRRLNKPDSLRSITIAGMASGFVQVTVNISDLKKLIICDCAKYYA